MRLLRSCESLWMVVETVDIGETPLKPAPDVVRYFDVEIIEYPAFALLKDTWSILYEINSFSLQVSYCCYRCKDKAAEKHRPVCEAFG